MSSRKRRKARRLRLALRAYGQFLARPDALTLWLDLGVRQGAVLRCYPHRFRGLLLRRDGIEFWRV